MSEKFDAYQAVTDKIIALLEAGTVPWRRPWDASHGFPRSLSTGRPYRGINPFLLQTTALLAGYGSPWWGTYDQIKARGGQVRKHEHGTLVTFWKCYSKSVANTEGEDERSVMVLRYYKVFNVDQAEGEMRLPVLPIPDVSPVGEFDGMVAEYLATGPRLTHGHSFAAYSPGRDAIMMPDRAAFTSAEEYCACLGHELGHSTGAATRLNREGIMETHRFGDEWYAKEELIAEMAASILCGVAGIATATVENSAAYIGNWLTALKDDRRFIVSAAGKAQRAADLIRGTADAVALADAA